MDDDYAIQNGIEDEIPHDNNRQLLSSETKECDDKARGQDYYKRWVITVQYVYINYFRLSQRLEVECRILFPLTFMGFCLCYWIYYCHIMDESEAIMENVTMYKIHDEN